MSTRGLHCIVVNGQYKVARYYHYDNYASGVGLELLHTVRRIAENNLFSQLEFNACTVKEVGSFSDSEIDSDISDTFDYILYHRGVKLYNDLQFSGDSLFCEFLYLLDTTKKTFEVYKGFTTEPLDKFERFAFVQPAECFGKTTYYQVHHVATFDVHNLPSDEEFVDIVDGDDEDTQ